MGIHQRSKRSHTVLYKRHLKCPRPLKSLKTPRLDVPLKKATYNLFYRDLRVRKNELKDANVSQARAILSRNRKNLKLVTRRCKSTVTFKKRNMSIWRDLPEISRKSYRRSGDYQPIQKVR